MNQLQDFEKEFIMELFLESDSISTVNRLVVAVANVINENNENNTMLNEILQKEINLNHSTLDSLQSVPSLKTTNLYEKYVLKYTDAEYEKRFKMKRSTVQALIVNLQDNVESSSTISLEKKVHVFLWLLTSDTSYGEVATLFSISKSSVLNIVHEIATWLASQQYHYLSWPSLDEQLMTQIKVYSRLKLPNCVGFIDACRLKIGSRLTKKGKRETILLQAVCDDSLNFIDIHIGELGKTKKHRVFKDSKLSKELKNLTEYDTHILGDSQYKLDINLITCFSSEELLTSEEMKFNEVHLKARSYIGRAFELLKERFRKLNHIDMVKMETVEALIRSACILHNFIRLHEGAHFNEVKQECVSTDDRVTIDNTIVTNAADKRQFLCNYINYIDSV